MIQVLEASMEYNKEDGYVGKVAFEVKNHKQPYELIIFSKKGKEWSYSLSFLHEPGGEEEIEAVEELLEEDEIYEQLIEAAKSKLPA
jgi:hypothetical protein